MLSNISRNGQNFKSNFNLNYPKEYYWYRNRSSDDSKINVNDDLNYKSYNYNYNYSFNYSFNYNLLEKTRKVLNYTPFNSYDNTFDNNL